MHQLYVCPPHLLTTATAVLLAHRTATTLLPHVHVGPGVCAAAAARQSCAELTGNCCLLGRTVCGIIRITASHGCGPQLPGNTPFFPPQLQSCQPIRTCKFLGACVQQDAGCVCESTCSSPHDELPAILRRSPPGRHCCSSRCCMAALGCFRGPCMCLPAKVRLQCWKTTLGAPTPCALRSSRRELQMLLQR